MSNPDQRFGLKPVGHLLGLDWSAGVRRCFMTGASGATYIGDPVDFAGSADASGAYPTIAPVANGATYPIMGVVVGFEPDPTDLTLLYRKNSTDRYAMVSMDPYVIYEIQGSTDAVLANTIVGANGVLIFTHGGSTATGLSGAELSAATTPAADPTYQLLILGAATDPLNDIASVNARWLVMLSLSRFNFVYSSGANAGLKGV